MRAADPGIELIATGNPFDIARPDPILDHTTADQVWNSKVIAACAEEMDYLSLHCLPANDVYLEKLTPSQAYYSLMAQPDAWERVFLPQLQQLIEHAPRADASQPPIRLAITEWGVLGPRNDVHPVVENYGEVVYAGIFLNMCIRNHALVPIANATGLLHGGCIRKAAGQVYHDPQYTVLQKYMPVAGMSLEKSEINSPSYNIQTAADLGRPLENIPYIDAVACADEAVACADEGTGRRFICAVNRHLQEAIMLQIDIVGELAVSKLDYETIRYSDVTARARLGETDRFAITQGSAIRTEKAYLIELPPCSVSWIRT